MIPITRRSLISPSETDKLSLSIYEIWRITGYARSPRDPPFAMLRRRIRHLGSWPERLAPRIFERIRPVKWISLSSSRAEAGSAYFYLLVTNISGSNVRYVKPACETFRPYTPLGYCVWITFVMSIGLCFCFLPPPHFCLLSFTFLPLSSCSFLLLFFKLPSIFRSL